MAYDQGELRYPTNNSSMQDPSSGVCAAWTAMWVNRILSDPASLNWTQATLPAAGFDQITASEAQSLYQDLRTISTDDAHDIMLMSVNNRLRMAKTQHNNFLSLTVDEAEIHLDLWELYDEFTTIVERLDGPIYASLMVFAKVGQYAGEGSCAHAIGFYNDRASGRFYVFDPNKGLVRYRDVDAFREDFVGLFMPGGFYHDYLNGMMTLRPVTLH